MSNKSNSISILAPLLLQIFPLISPAKTIKVPLHEPTIQAAIDIALDGDIIQVHPGTYFENIDFRGKAISVIGERSARPTIIDGRSKGSVVTFSSGEGPTSVLSGFIIQNGRSGFDTTGFGDGGGILINNSSPTIRYNNIRNNKACSGAGITISFGSPLVQRNRIENNAQAGCSGGIGGGGISIRGSVTARIFDNIIENNFIGSADGGGISLFAAGTPKIRRNIIRGNTATGLSPCASGGGISMFNQSDATIIQNLIIGNTAGCGGGIYWLVPSGYRGPFLVNNTIADNSGAGVFADGFDANSRLINNLIVASAGQTALFCGDFNDNNPPIIRFNDIFSRDGSAYDGICADQTGIDGNLSTDPLFQSVAIENYHIQKSSPVIDAGNNKAPNITAIDFDGGKRIQDGNLDGTAVVDMGIDEFVSAQGDSLSELSAIDDSSDRLLPINNSQNQSRDRIYEASSDSRSTVFAYDAAGHTITYTDVSGVKYKYTLGR